MVASRVGATMARVVSMVLVGIVPGVVALLATATVNADVAAAVTGGNWPMYAGGATHEAWNPAASTLNPRTVPGLRVTHSYTGWHLLQSNPLVVAGSLAYGLGQGSGVQTGVYLRAFAIPGGNKVWEQLVCKAGDSQCHFSAPAVSNGDVFVGGTSAMYAFNAISGRRLWVTTIPADEFTQVTVSGSTVFAASETSETVYAFDALTGRVLWKAAPPGCCATPVTVASGGLAYVVTDHLVAYNPNTGALVFSVVSGPAGLVTVSGGTAYVLNNQTCALEAFSAKTGAALWSVPTDANPGSCSGPAALAVAGSVLVEGSGRYLIGFAASTGARLWTHDGGTQGAYYSPAINNNVVYVGESPSGLEAVNVLHGGLLYTSGFACITPIAARNSVYAWCSSGSGLPYVMTSFGL